MMQESPVSQVLITLDKPLQDEIITDSGLKFFLDPSYNKNYQATVTGKIAALPINPKTKQDKEILSQLKVGDEVCFSYMVVADMCFSSDSHRFVSTHEENDLMQSYVNGFGYRLDVVALPGKISKIWVGYYRDKLGRLIDGKQGTQHDVERWMAQFPMGKTDEYTFNNFFEYEGQDFWKCDLTDIFAKKTDDGHLLAVGDRVICKAVEEEIPVEVRRSLSLPTDDVKIRYTDRGRVISGGKKKGLKKEQVIAFNPRYLERYEFFGKEYYLIREDFVLGIWSKN